MLCSSTSTNLLALQLFFQYYEGKIFNISTNCYILAVLIQSKIKVKRMSNMSDKMICNCSFQMKSKNFQNII